MLAKVLPGGGDKPLSNIQWPSAQDCSQPKAPAAAPSGEHLHLAELTDLRRALQQAKSDLENTKAEGDRRAQEAYQKGRAEGEAALRKALEPQIEAELAKLRQMIRDLIAVGPKLRHQAEEDLVRLAVAIARRVLHREITIDPDAMVGLVKAAFARMDQKDCHQIRTDPESLSVVQRIVAELNIPNSVKLLADPSLRRGSLVMETTRGHMDASLETQLQEIQRGFADFVAHS